MPMFRKKPVVIEAVQWFSLGQSPRGWAVKEYQTFFECHTLEGDMRGEPGDWIIKGVKGEVYPCKPDIFALTYEPA